MEKIFFDLIVKEDSPQGDVTTQAIFGHKAQQAKGVFLAKEDLVLSGANTVQRFLKAEFPQLKVKWVKRDGQSIKKGTKFGEITGPVQRLLVAERVILNLLQRMSGIATLTSDYVRQAKNHKVQILDTRKTTPGLRLFEKQAVLDGGGKNHRMSLSDQYLIKDNHIVAAGSVSQALEKVLAHKRKSQKKIKIEIEVKNLAELREALAFKPDIILLDNMSVGQIRRAVEIRNQMKSKTALEVSGGVSLKSLKTYLNVGVERISIGALTHSARAVDISLKIEI